MSSSVLVPFWDIHADSDKPFIYWNGEVRQTFGSFVAEANDWQKKLATAKKSLVLLFVPHIPESVALLTGALATGNAVMLADPALPEQTKKGLENAYLPHIVVDHADERFTVATQESRDYRIHSDLSLLLSTSGSTGSPKYVRLSKNNIVSNAHGISEVLQVQSDDVASAHLEFHYSYGWSVVSSHILNGASLSMSSGKFTDRLFWSSMRDSNITHLPGVPLHFQFMSKLGFARLSLSSLKVLTQAGGKLSLPIKEEAHSYMDSKQGRFYVMYGQTEASPRMSTLEHSVFREKTETVGLPLAGGQFSILDSDHNPVESGSIGQVQYKGPNVMMGYSTGFEDLEKGDELNGELDTGDLGFLDDDGFLTITGRSSRVGKIYGWRINLDEVETAVNQFTHAAVIEHSEKVAIVCIDSPELTNPLQDLVDELAKIFPLPRSAYNVHKVREIPVNARGKTDYGKVKSYLNEITQS